MGIKILFMILAILMLVSVGCTLTEDKTIYKINIGSEKVACDSGMHHNCGYHLYECDTGKEYYCTTNVEVIK